MALPTSTQYTGTNFVLPPPIKGRNGEILAYEANVLKNLSSGPKTIEGLNITDDLKNSIGLRLLCNSNHINSISLNSDDSNDLKESVKEAMDDINSDLKPLLTTLESDLRYGWIDEILLQIFYVSISLRFLPPNDEARLLDLLQTKCTSHFQRLTTY